jgi:ABC-type amino acid transport substrate-binding protein
VNEGTADVETLRIEGIEKIYANLVPGTVSIGATYVHAYAIRKDISVKNGIKDLAAYRIGVLRGTKITEEITEGLKRELINDQESMVKMLEAGRLDVIVSTASTFDPLLKKTGKEKLIIRLEPPLAARKVLHFVNKKYAYLLPRIDSEMKLMIKDGTVDKIFGLQ